MPFTSFKVVVDAPAAVLWAMMEEKVRRPDKYVPGITRAEIRREISPTSVERVMYATGDLGEKTIHEIISWDKATMTVVFKLLNDPVYTGIVTNTVFDEDGKVELGYVMHWTAKDPSHPGQQGKEPDWAQGIRAAVLKAKALAEAPTS